MTDSLVSDGWNSRPYLPVVIVSLDVLNERLQTVTVCLMTSALHPDWRSRLQVRCGRQNADIAVDRIRTISKSRLGDKIGRLTDDQAAALRRLITEFARKDEIE